MHDKISTNQTKYQKILDKVHFMINCLRLVDSVAGKRKLTIIYKKNSYE